MAAVTSDPIDVLRRALWEVIVQTGREPPNRPLTSGTAGLQHRAASRERG
jgi:hypothetical protein